MQRFLIRLALFFGLQIVLYIGVLGKHYKRDYNHHLAGTIIKNARLESTESPRIIVVGGSGAAYGTNSPMLSDAFPGYHPVNMALHGGLSLDFMLNESGSRMRPGDIVIVTPEYPGLVGYQNTDKLLRVLEYRPSSVIHLTWSQFRHFLDEGFTVYLGALLREVLPKIGDEPAKARGPLQRFNDFGDHVLQYGRPRKGIANSKLSMRFNEKSLETAVERLNRFAEKCRRKQVVAVLAYPTVPEASFEPLRETARTLDDRLRRDVSMPIINRPEDAVLPGAVFYDTVYHLMEEGGRLRTQHLIESLRPVMPETSPEQK